MKEEKILIADDEAKIRNVINIYLRKEGFTVREAENGRQALEMAISENFDLIILDIMMPEMDGWTVCREIKKLSDTPVIMLSARGEEYDRIFGFELGTDDYVPKPFSPRELVMRVKAVLKRTSGTTRDDILSCGSLSINRRSKQAFLDAGAIMLTPKEYDLLLFLLKNRKKAHSRQMLLNSVWGIGYRGDIRTVDTHIKQLRNKLGKYKDCIKTVWGTGYIMDIEEENADETEHPE